MSALLTIMLIVIAGTTIITFLSGIALYNRIVTMRSTIRSSRSDIEIRLGSRPGRIDNSIENAIQDLNSAVRHYNSLIDTFPSNVIASGMGLEKEEYLELRERKLQ